MPKPLLIFLMHPNLHFNSPLKLLVLFISILGAVPAFAQLNFSHSISQTAYVPITGTILTGGPAAGTDDEAYPAITLPFTFNYDGQNFTQIVPNTNGVIFMGAVGGTAFGDFFRITTAGAVSTMPSFSFRC
jgi:hypothetical protein